jgi:hypothetical protein
MTTTTTPFRFAALLAAALLPLAACGDSTGPGRSSGSTDFTYSGALAGSFHANGSPTLNFETGSFAFGQRTTLEGDDALLVLAQQDGAGDLVDNLLFSISDPAVGTVTCDGGEETCPFDAFFVLGANGRDPEQDADALLFSTGGTVSVTSLSSTRARGTFQITVSDLFGDGPEVHATSGTFDVPLMSSTNFSRARFGVAGRTE